MNFSVLISVYHRENPVFFKTAINSIINQELPPSEIVLVKDGPLTDMLENAIAEFTTQHNGLFNIVTIPENKGLGNALKVGLEVCQYEIVARMDTDDISLPQRFRKQIDFLNTHPEIAVVGTSIEEFNTIPGDLGSRRELPTGGEELLKYAKYRSPANHATIMFRKNAVINSGNYNGDILLWEDFTLFIRILQHGYQFYNIPETLFYVRVGDGLQAIKRRSGWHYFKSEWEFASYAKTIGHLSLSQWLLYVSIKLPMRLLPSKVVLFIYNKFLRKK